VVEDGVEENNGNNTKIQVSTAVMNMEVEQFKNQLWFNLRVMSILNILL